MPVIDGVNYVIDFAAKTTINHVVSSALKAGVNAILVPTQMLLAVGTAAATAITTYLIMTTAKLALAGMVYVGSEVYNGVTYFLYRPDAEKPKSEEWDDADVALCDPPSKRSLEF